MENKKPTQFLMKPKVDFCFKELMEDEEVRNAFLAAVLGIAIVKHRVKGYNKIRNTSTCSSKYFKFHQNKGGACMENKKPTQFLMKPKVDFCFKELMEDEEVRNAFLAAVLGINLEEINESKILPSHLRQKDKDDKLGILDVRVLLNNREQIDIEIQVTFSEYWAERTLFYLGKMFTDQLKPGENYQNVRVLLNNREQIDIEIQVTFSEYWAERTLFYLGKMFTDQLKPGENYQKLEKCIHIGILNDIEIQVTFSEYWAERTLFYLGKMFTDQLKPGENYQKLEKCIHIGILNFIMFDDEEYYSRFHFWSDKGRKLYSDKFEIHTLELPKLAKHDYAETELHAETELQFEMAAEKSEYIKKAYEDLNRISADEEKRLEYEERERAIRDHQYFSTVYKNTGLKEGRLEYEERERAIRDHQYFSTVYKNTGLKEGRREGRQEGIQAVVELLQEMELEKEVICGKVQEKFHISAQEAAQEVEKYWK